MPRFDHPAGDEIVRLQAEIDRLLAVNAELLALLKLAQGDAEHVLNRGWWDQVDAAIAKAGEA
jgi:hypothetical protein